MFIKQCSGGGIYSRGLTEKMRAPPLPHCVFSANPRSLKCKAGLNCQPTTVTKRDGSPDCCRDTPAHRSSDKRYGNSAHRQSNCRRVKHDKSPNPRPGSLVGKLRGNSHTNHGIQIELLADPIGIPRRIEPGNLDHWVITSYFTPVFNMIFLNVFSGRSTIYPILPYRRLRSGHLKCTDGGFFIFDIGFATGYRKHIGVITQQQGVVPGAGIDFQPGSQ